jgi:hypothetical protein
VLNEIRIRFGIRRMTQNLQQLADSMRLGAP